jgi:hypothetical protein
MENNNVQEHESPIWRMENDLLTQVEHGVAAEKVAIPGVLFL